MQVVAELDSGSINRLAKKRVFIVGLAGQSGSGKSTVAKRVASRLKGHVLSMENYSIVMNHLSLEERAKQKGNIRVFGASVDVNDAQSRIVAALSRSSDRLPLFFALMVRKSRWTCARVRARHSEIRRPCS
jgi:adenylylsulfate kinase-like enzyme